MANQTQPPTPGAPFSHTLAWFALCPFGWINGSTTTVVLPRQDSNARWPLEAQSASRNAPVRAGALVAVWSPTVALRFLRARKLNRCTNARLGETATPKLTIGVVCVAVLNLAPHAGVVRFGRRLGLHALHTNQPKGAGGTLRWVVVR